MVSKVSIASIEIDFTISSQCEATFRNHLGEQLTLSGPLSSDQLSAEISNISRNFSESRQNLSTFDISDVTCFRELQRLHSVGRNLLYKMFDNNIEDLPELQQLCRRGCRDWQRPRWDRSGLDTGLTVVYTNRQTGIPFDILPLFDLVGLDVETKKISKVEIGKLAKSFLGFSTVVQKVFSSRAIVDRCLEANPQLPVRFLRDARLQVAGQEFKFLEAQSKWLMVDGPWPKKGDLGSSTPATALVEFMLNGRPDKLEPGLPRRYQILHFSCHCDASTSGFSDDHNITFSEPGWLPSRLSVTLRELRDQLYQKAIIAADVEKRNFDGEIASGPLIILNACNSAGLNPSSFGSFLSVFLNRALGFRGVIATEVEVPEIISGYFTREFYSHLQNHEIGTALMESRWGMLRKFNNPFLIFFSLYAEAAIGMKH